MVGQDHVGRALGNALRSGRPAQGCLFSGPRGTGKRPRRASSRAAELPVEPGADRGACGRCDSCRRTGQPDWLDVGGRRRLQRAPHRRDARVAGDRPPRGGEPVPHHDHGRGPPDPGPGGERLLKTLEEPPHLVVILCTTQPWDILGTIRSRLQHYVLRKPGIPALTRVLDRGARRGDRGRRAGARHPGPRGRRLVPRRPGPARSDLDLRRRAGRGERRPRAHRRGVARVGVRARRPDGRRGRGGRLELLQSTLDGPVDSSRRSAASWPTCGTSACCSRAPARATSGPSRRRRSPASRPSRPAPRRPQVVHGLDLLADAQVRIRHGGADLRLRLELVAARLSRPALDATAAALASRTRRWRRAPPRSRAVLSARRARPRSPGRAAGAGAAGLRADAADLEQRAARVVAGARRPRADAPPRAASSTARGRPRSTSGGWSWR